MADVLQLCCAMLLTFAVVLPTPHDYSGTNQGGYSARYMASRKVLYGSKNGSLPFKNNLEKALTTSHVLHASFQGMNTWRVESWFLIISPPAQWLCL